MARQERAAPLPAAVSAARIADGIVEAGWLLAVLLVPVFFNIHSGRPFEPDKTALLRLLALLIAAASVGRLVEERVVPPAGAGTPWRWRESPLAVSALVYLGAAALSTAFSIAPSLSLWGSHTRLEGLVTLLAHVTVFAAVATRLRRREQLDRLLDAAVAASVPVCLYGFVQRAGRDPLDWRVPFQEWRISTTLGNPIFAGDYLAIALALTLAAFAWWWTRRGDAGRTRRLAVYGVAAAMQLAALGLTGSRGPWLGAATALGGLALLLAAVQGRRRLAAATLALGVAAAVFVAVLNVPRGPLERLRRGPVLGRLGHLFADPDNRNPGDRARVLGWQGSLKLARLPQPVVVPGRGPDGAAALRGVVGFGPETLQEVFGAVYDPAFAEAERRNPDVSVEGTLFTFSTRMPDRSHNEVLDSLVFGGAIGLLAYLMLQAAVQYTGLRALGLVGSRRDAMALAACCLGGAALTVVGSGLGLSWAYVGVALPLGLVAGWTAFVLAAALRKHPAAAGPDALLVAGLAAALLGHFVSGQFGPAVVTARLYFWALAGVLLALTRLERAEPPTEAPAQGSNLARVAAPAAALGLVIVYDFAGLKPSGGGRAAVWLVCLQAGATLAAWTIATARSLRGGALAAGAAALITAAYAFVHLRALEATALVGSIADLQVALEGHFSLLALLLLACAIGLGAALGRATGERVAPSGLLRLGGVVAVPLVLVVPSLLNAVNADVLRRFAVTFQGQNQLALAVGLYERATRLAPGDAVHFQGLGEALLAATRLREPAPRAPELLTRAEAAFQRAQSLDPLGADHAVNLARLARRRSELEKDPAAARRQAEAAARLYEQTLALVPGNTMLLNERAELEYQRLGDFAAAERTLERSRQMDPRFDYTMVVLGDFYMSRAAERGSRDDFRLAAAAFQEALNIRRTLKAQVSLGAAYKEMGDSDSAIRLFEEALQAPPPPAVASTLHEQLAGLYRQRGEAGRARGHAAQALAHAPADARAALEARLRAAGLVGP